MMFAVRALSILVAGLFCVVVALWMLDVPFERDVVAWFFVLPAGAVLATAALWALVMRYLRD